MTEYTPSTEQVREDFATRMAPFRDDARRREFDRWLDRVRAEAQAKALEEAADHTPILWDFPPHASALQIRPWLRDRANQYKEGK